MARQHQVDEPGNVLAVVTIAHLEREVLVHGGADGEDAVLVAVDADDRERAGLGQRLHRPLQRQGRGVAGMPVVAVGVALGRHLFGLGVELLLLVLEALGRRARVRALGVHADGVDGAVDADAAGELLDGGDRLFLAEVDDLGALRPRHRQPGGDLVDGEDASRAEQAGAGDGELPHRAAAEDRHRVAGANLR